MLFPSLLASAVATVVFVLLSGTFFETLYQFPDYTPKLRDLFYAVPLGLIGGVVGCCSCSLSDGCNSSSSP